jgi:hypothetical protein
MIRTFKLGFDVNILAVLGKDLGYFYLRMSDFFQSSGHPSGCPLGDKSQEPPSQLLAKKPPLPPNLNY